MNEKVCRGVVLLRSEGLCERCTGYGQTVHHRKKRSHLSKKEMWLPSNCVLLCGDGVRGCHGWVEHHPDLAATEGFHVRPWEDPAEIPVLWRGTRLVLLTDEGGFKPWGS